MAYDVFANSFINCLGSFMPSGIGMGTGPAYMPVISPSNASPRRSEMTALSASFIEAATGAANCAHASIVPSTHPARVSGSASPAGGLNAVAMSSHRLASLIARRMVAPSSAVTEDSLPDELTRCNAIDLASLTLIGPSLIVCCISPNEFIPPPMKACMSDCTCCGSGRLSAPRLSSCSRISSGRLLNCEKAISPWTGPKQLMNH
jgi:hypothetical protein